MVMRILLLLVTFGATLSAEDFGGKSQMNGLSLEAYKGFEEKWRLVTVRYRKDTGEMRFIYANPLAWKTLSSGEVTYPDGAVFAKIGVALQDDPAFTSSLVPGGAKRYQLMVRDSKKHASTGGWGYALFNERGRTLNEDPVLTTQACYACHQTVAYRGEVFAQPMALALGQKPWPGAGAAKVSNVQFADKPVHALPEPVRGWLPADVKSVRSIEGKLRTHLFSGTLNEIRPALIKESLRTGQPAVLLSEDGERFALAYTDGNSASCRPPATHSIRTMTTALDEKGKLRTIQLQTCEKK